MQDCEGWAEDYSLWVKARCVFRDGTYGGVAALGKHFCAWCAERGEAGPWPATFATLLSDEGFHVTERGMVQLVYGLLLREDWEESQPGTSRRQPRTRVGANTTTARREGSEGRPCYGRDGAGRLARQHEGYTLPGIGCWWSSAPGW